MTTQVKSDSSDLAKKHGMGNMSQVPPEVQAKALKDAKGSIPGKYQIPDTSDIEVTVKEESTTLTIELKRLIGTHSTDHATNGGTATRAVAFVATAVPAPGLDDDRSTG